MSRNAVFLNPDGLIEIHVVGNQTVASINAMGVKVANLAQTLREHNKPILVVDNLLHMGEVPQEARTRVVELGKSLDYDKLAMIGSNNLLRLGANLLIRAIGKSDSLRYFESYQSAKTWLIIAEDKH